MTTPFTETTPSTETTASSEQAGSPAAETSTRAPQVWGTLQANDALTLIDFYVDVFGFLRTAVYADGEVVQHAQLDWPEGGGIMLGSYQPEGAWKREPGTAGFYVVTDDVHAVHDRVVAVGARVTRELDHTDYGSFEFSCADPEGNHWSFGTYRGEPRPS